MVRVHFMRPDGTVGMMMCQETPRVGDHVQPAPMPGSAPVRFQVIDVTWATPAPTPRGEGQPVWAPHLVLGPEWALRSSGG